MKDLFQLRSFIFIWIGQSGFGLGSTFATFVISWLLYDMTGSKAAMGGIWFAFFFTSSISSLVIGPYVDKFQNKKVMIFSEWGRAFIFLSLTLTYQFGVLEVWMLYVIGIMIGMVEPMYRPAAMAYVTKVVPDNQLLRANSTLEGTAQLMNLGGPLLSGILIATIGPHSILVSLVVLLAALGGVLCLLPNTPQTEQVKKKQSWLKDFKEGLAFYQKTPILLWLGVLVTWINFTFGAFQSMTFPFVLDHLKGDAFQVGLFQMVLSCGMLFGAIWFGMRKRTYKLRNILIGSVILQGALVAILGWIPNYWAVLIPVFLIGITLISFNVNNTTLYQKMVPKDLQGRVFTLRMLFAQAGLPVGAAIGGIFAESLGLKTLFSILGGSILIISLIAWFLPIFVRLDDDNVENATIPVLKGSVGS